MNDALQTLDGLVDSVHDELEAQPAADADAGQRLAAEARWWTEQRLRVWWGRAVILGGSALIIAMLGLGGRSPLDPAAGLSLGMLCLAVGLAGRPRVWAQAMTRGCLWAAALLGGAMWWIYIPFIIGPARVTALYAESGEGSVPSLTADLLGALVPVVALLVLGMHGLERPSERVFRPVAFRRLLALSLVMGLADAVLLLGVGAAALAKGLGHPGPWLVAACLLVGVWGLARLRTWGLAVIALGNLAEIVILLVHPQALFGEEMLVLLVTAAIQVLLPGPVYGAMLLGRRPEPGQVARLEARLPTVVLGGLTLLAIGSWVAIVWPLLLG